MYNCLKLKYQQKYLRVLLILYKIVIVDVKEFYSLYQTKENNS